MPREVTRNRWIQNLLPRKSGAREEDISREVDIDYRMQQLSQLTDDLTLEHTETSTSLDEDQSQPHTIQTIPDDILLNIFLRTVHHPCHHPSGLARTPTLTEMTKAMRTPWTLSHVSRRWRHSVLEFPTLWSSFYFDLSQAASFPHRLCLLHLERAQNCALHIVLCAGSRLGAHEDGGVVLRRLLEVSSSWKSLMLFIEPSWADALLHIQGRLQSLEELEVVTVTSSEKLSPLLWPAPSLKYVQWYHIPSMAKHVTWPSLRSPILIYRQSDHIEPASLRSFPKLSIILPMQSHTTLPSTISVSPDPNPCSSNHLTSLLLGMSDGDAMIIILRLLELPALTQLHLSVSTSAVNDHHLSAVEMFLARSKCTLRNLTWLGLDLLANPAKFLRFLATIPSLTGLVLGSVTGDIIQGLRWAVSQQPENLLPRLTLLGVDLSCDPSLLLEMVQSRNGFLQYLRLIHRYTLPPDVLEGLRECQARGLKVTNGILEERQALHLDVMDEIMCTK